MAALLDILDTYVTKCLSYQTMLSYHDFSGSSGLHIRHPLILIPYKHSSYKKYMDNPPERMTSLDIRRMSEGDDELLFFFHHSKIAISYIKEKK